MEGEKNRNALCMTPEMEELAAQMPGGFFIYRADGEEEILYANEVLFEIFGCGTWEEFKKLTGGTFRGMVYPEDLDGVEAAIVEQVAESERQLDYVEYRITRRDGKIRWIDDYGRLAPAPDGGSVYYVMVRDITDLRASREEGIRKAEVIEGLSVDFSSILLLNLDTGSMRVYRDEGNIFGRLTEKLPEPQCYYPDWRTLLEHYAGRHVIAEDRTRYREEVSETHIRERLRSEVSYTVDYRSPGSDGNMVYMQMSIVRIDRSKGGQRVVMGYRDITEQVMRLQQEMSDKLKMELALEQEKHANEIKSSFLFNVSHDIRTPMNAIMGFTELSRRHVREPERLTEYLVRLDESNRHMLGLIDDLLEMSQIGYGRIELKDERCNLREQLELVLDMFRGRTEEKNILLEKHWDLPEEDVYVDARRFRRVMSNLVSNAVKFTPEHGKIMVSARQVQKSDSGFARYEFSVIDNGAGISKTFLRKIYDAFEREETSTRTGKPGTGLGLTIAKTLLDMMGGSIRVASEKGKGTAFTVDLPMKLADGAGNIPGDAGASGESAYHSDGTRRILLVEDIEINRMLAETILEDAGFEVESAPDGCDAVESIKRHPPGYFDLVLMDIQMPVMNGYEATRAIRALGRPDTADIPIIALSANARDEDRQMSIDSGMNQHIAKPFDVAQLITTVNEHIMARNARKGQ